MISFYPLACLTLATASLAESPRTVAPPPEESRKVFDLDPFYQKAIFIGGLPIVGSAQVEDRSLLEAAFLVENMLAHRPELLPAMAKNKVRLAVMARNEFTTSIPEHRTLRPANYWDRRARGLGASPSRPAVSCGEENLLCLRGDPYGTENILIHEFGHAIHEMGLTTTDPTFDRRLKDTYTAAMKTGLYAGKYASMNRMEYWAEGVQSWFDTNRENDHDHNHVNTRAELKDYDPALAKLLAEVFGDTDWRYQRPEKRAEAAHFAGFDRQTAVAFTWPAEIADWTDRGLADTSKTFPNLEAVTFYTLAEAENPPSSRNGGKAVTLILANSTTRELSVAWVDPKGNLTPHGFMRPGFISLQETYAGHVWLITDPDGKKVGYATAGTKDGRVLVK